MPTSKSQTVPETTSQTLWGRTPLGQDMLCILSGSGRTWDWTSWPEGLLGSIFILQMGNTRVP